MTTQSNVEHFVNLALIDGGNRYDMARAAWPVIEAGGWLVLDDAQRYPNLVDEFNQRSKGLVLGWDPEHDLESAMDRVAIAWQK